MANPQNFQKRNADRKAAAKIDGDKIRLMAGAGHPGTAIAAALGRTPQAIRSFCCREGIKLKPQKKPAHGYRFKLPDDLLDAYRLEGAARGMSPQRLALQILTTVQRDNLFLAVLDVSAKPPVTVKPAPVTTKSDPRIAFEAPAPVEPESQPTALSAAFHQPYLAGSVN